jgi:hypothetical protein
MHDAKGRPLRMDDVVLIPCRIISLSATPDRCNVTVKSLLGRSPDGQRETIVLNTKQLLRFNDEEDLADNPKALELSRIDLSETAPAQPAMAGTASRLG